MSEELRDAYEDVHTAIVMALGENNALCTHIRERVAALRAEADALEAILLKAPTKETQGWYDAIQLRRKQLRS